MRYYVVADIHGFFTELTDALKFKGFFKDKMPHKLVICGDLFDRGNEAKQLLQFVLDEMDKDEIILIRGNHEDLIYDLVENIDKYANENIIRTHHWHNGTVETLFQLAENDLQNLLYYPQGVRETMLSAPLFTRVFPAMLDYYETKKYVFTHGWIPCDTKGYNEKISDYKYIENWREASDTAWGRARWYNGMEAAKAGVIEPYKTIVCGHFHCSYGHSVIDNEGTEFGEDADFSPYTARGITAIDACTAFSGKVNCVVIEDEWITEN